MCKFLVIGFFILYGLALVIWLVGTFGWFGAERDPLSGVYLVILGQPWTRWVDLLPEALWPVGAALMPAINGSILYAICRLLNRG